MTVILFTTAGCHLCEQARDLLRVFDVEVVPTEIGDDDILTTRYGILIPVLKFTNGSELHWPFSQQDIKVKLSLVD